MELTFMGHPVTYSAKCVGSHYILIKIFKNVCAVEFEQPVKKNNVNK